MQKKFVMKYQGFFAAFVENELNKENSNSNSILDEICIIPITNLIMNQQ